MCPCTCHPGPTLWGTLIVSDLDGVHTRANEEDRQHGAEHHDALAILHCLLQQCPLEACEILDGNGSPDPDVHKEQLEGEIDDALHGR